MYLKGFKVNFLKTAQSGETATVIELKVLLERVLLSFTMAKKRIKSSLLLTIKT